MVKAQLRQKHVYPIKILRLKEKAQSSSWNNVQLNVTEGCQRKLGIMKSNIMPSRRVEDESLISARGPDTAPGHQHWRRALGGGFITQVSRGFFHGYWPVVW